LPESEDYVFPRPAAGELTTGEASRLEEAWRAVLAGDTRRAEREAGKLVLARPTSPAPYTVRAFAALRAGRAEEAADRFAAVLERHASYVPALVGAATTAARRNDPAAALDLWRRAQAADPADPLVRRRLAETKLRVTERRLAAGRAALQEGQPERAREELESALDAAPEVGEVRVELANTLLALERTGEAVELLEKDVSGDRAVLLRLGEILTGQQEYERALAAYARVLSRDPQDVEARQRAREAQEALVLLRMPEEYRRIPGNPRVSRAELAALLGAKVTALGRVTARSPKVAIDIGGSWAREPIALVLALDIMDVYPNHTFQPSATVRRGDLARAVGRVLDLVGWSRTPGPAPRDMAPTHLQFDGVSRSVGAGLMELDAQGAFEPWRPVSGREAADVVDALVRLIGP
jgi:tetratricopeptide (TPR) repeat protein